MKVDANPVINLDSGGDDDVDMENSESKSEKHSMSSYIKKIKCIRKYDKSSNCSSI